jgi:O-antigen/teichoic acid export membrane protein
MKQISKNFLSLFISDAVSRILGFIATVYIARVLTVQGFGLISYGLAFLTYALLFANPGLTTIGAREIAKDHSNRRIIEDILGLRLGLACIILLIFIFGVLVIPGLPITKKIIVLYLLSLFPFAMLLEFVFQGIEKMEFIGVARLMQYGIYALLLLILLKSDHDILMVPVSFLAGYAVAAVFLIIIFLQRYKLLKIRFSVGLWRQLLVSSIPVGLAIIFNQIALYLPPIVLGICHSQEEVGLFSAGFKIITMLLIVERVFYYVFFPAVSRQYKEVPEQLKNSFAVVSRLLFAILVPIVFGGFILSTDIIHFIFGAKFEAAIPVFRILILYFLVTPLNTIFGYGLVAINQEKRFLKVISITSLINLILIITLGIYFKGPGAAAALFISEVIGIRLMNRELKKFVSFKSVKYIYKPIVVSCIMSIILYLSREWHIIILIIIGASVYVIIFYLIKGFSKEELRRLLIAFTEK